jgi:hypothetical protein
MHRLPEKHSFVGKGGTGLFRWFSSSVSPHLPLCPGQSASHVGDLMVLLSGPSQFQPHLGQVHVILRIDGRGVLVQSFGVI